MSKLQESISCDAKPYQLFVKGVCLASQGRQSECKKCFDVFLGLGLNFGESRAGAEKILASFADGSIEALLADNKANNIKKLRLKKYTE